MHKLHLLEGCLNVLTSDGCQVNSQGAKQYQGNGRSLPFLFPQNFIAVQYAKVHPG